MRSEIANSLELLLRNMREMVADLDDAQMVRQPAGVPNHPAWTIGHIVHSFESIGEDLRLEPWLPDDWAARFKTGSPPVAEAGTYPTKQKLLDRLVDGERRVRERVLALDDAELHGPFPTVRYREMFPTLGHALVHVLVGHTASHVGQLAVWRRAMGLPPATMIV